MLRLLLGTRLCPPGNTNKIRIVRLVPALIDHRDEIMFRETLIRTREIDLPADKIMK